MKTKAIIILIEISVLMVLATFICMIWTKEDQEAHGNYEVAWCEPVSMEAMSEDMRADVSVKHVTMTAIGDIMMHQWQITRGYDASTDTFDYAESFTYIEPYLSEADFTFGNLETTFAGRYNGSNSDIHGYACYPMFNAPEVLGNNMQDVGVDFVATANNHSLDSGYDGLCATLDYLDSIGMDHVGTARTPEEQQELCIVEVNGITFGFSCYTYATNGIPVPSGAPYCVNTLELYEEQYIDAMCEEVRALDAAGVDVVMPIIHFGTEYREMPDSWQEMCVDRLFAAGADVIVGGHPHVVEPMEIRQITNPDGTTKTGYVIYSLGNFISSQRYETGVMKDIGLVMDMEFEKKGDTTTLVGWRFAPTYVYWKDDVIGVVPVVEAYQNREAYSFLEEKDWVRIEDSYNKTIQTLTKITDCPYEIVDYEYNFQISE
ncbi:MAG: CapA family protein [Lachnospiraceae bacterium]|nr:CapA family protein [Lachnospiraceae bacterium]